MKKRYVILIMFMFNSLLSMESASMGSSRSEESGSGELLLLGNNYLKHQFVKPDDWPFVPLNNMKKSIELLPESSQLKIYTYDKSLFISCIGSLPPEIINFITYKMFGGRKASVEEVNTLIRQKCFTNSDDLSLNSVHVFMTMPFIHAFKNYVENKDIFTKIPHLQHKPVGAFLGLSQEKQEAIVNVYTPTPKAKILFGTAALTEQEWQQVENLDEGIRKEYFDQEEVIVLDEKMDDQCNRCGSNQAKAKIAALGVCVVASDALFAGGLKMIGLSDGVVGGVFAANFIIAGLVFGGFWYHKQRQAAQVKRL